METPRMFGKYEILSTLGQGGMGVVYRAQDPRIGRQVAIKTVTQDLSSDPTVLQRFHREAEKMGMLKHPNIITVYDLGEQDGFPYIVMEYVEGEPLDRTIKSKEQLPITYKLWVIQQVCSALGYAHQHDVVHRDVKPANVIVRPDGVAKLLDFGIARQETSKVDLRLTQAGGIIGTVAYIAPERLKGAPLDGRCDIFAAGVLLFQFLTGELPFSGTEVVLVNKLVNEKHPPLSYYLESYPAALDGIIDRSLAKDPDDRYQTAEEMATDLGTVIEMLKAEFASEMISQARRQTAESDFVGARDTLQQLLKLDNQQPVARRLLAEVRQHLTLKMRAEHALQKRRQATEAIRSKRYDEAIQLLEEAERLVPDDSSLAEELLKARFRKKTNDQIMGLLVQADAAKKIGDYSAARANLEEAIKLDTNNSRLRAAYMAILKQAEDAAQAARIQELVNSANEQMKQRNFRAVLSIIEEAQQLEPLSTELQDIKDSAKENLAEEERRRALDEIEELISCANTREELLSVSLLVKNALDKSPSDPSLLRCDAQLGVQIRELERQELVAATIRRSSSIMEASPLQALEAVRKTLQEVPGDEKLMALEASLKARIARRSEEETRKGILLEAREALTLRHFADAVTILEQCQGTLLTQEIADLLTFAKQELDREQNEKKIAAAYSECAKFRDEGKPEAIIQLLSPLLTRMVDPRLSKMLSDAHTQVSRRLEEEETTVSGIRRLLDLEYYEEVVLFIQALPEHLIHLPQIVECCQFAMEGWELQFKQLDRSGSAYGLLNPLNSALAFDEVSDRAEKDSKSGIVQKLLASLDRRRSEFVDSVLLDEMEMLRNSAVPGGRSPNASSPKKSARFLQFATDSVRAQWLLLQARNEPTPLYKKVFRRMGPRVE